MKIGVMICLLMLTVPMTQAGAETGAFEPAKRIGAAGETTFFVFSTSVGNYTLRHDGLCEVSVNGKRRTFWLKVGGRGQRVYFYEYEGDLVLLFEGSDKTGYLSRVNQQTRKTRWLTQIKSYNIGPPVVEGDIAYFGAVDVMAKVDLKTGAYLNDGALHKKRKSTAFQRLLYCSGTLRISVSSALIIRTGTVNAEGHRDTQGSQRRSNRSATDFCAKPKRRELSANRPGV